jgi:peptide/nickel transport system substrate-binding protein
MLTAALPATGRSRVVPFAAALLLLAACKGADRAAAAAGAGTVIIAATSEPTTLFPPRVTNSQESAVVASVFDRLAEIGPALNAAGDAGFTPRLAKAWTWAPDSLSIAFAIDPRAKWHDGVSVRAEDVRYSFHVYTAPAVASAASSLLSNIDSVSVRDSLSAVFWFKRRTPQQFMDATYSLFIRWAQDDSVSPSGTPAHASRYSQIRPTSAAEPASIA